MSQSEHSPVWDYIRVTIDFLRDQKFLVMDLFENHIEEISSQIEVNLNNSKLNTAQKTYLWKHYETVTNFVKGKCSTLKIV